MIWLLLQIGLCLLLAALAGWFLGWSMRGFRDTDQAEDLRQTLSATVDVKDRELSGLSRQVESLRSRSDALENTNRSLEAKLDETTTAATPEAPRGRAQLAAAVSQPVPETIPERPRGGAAVEVLEDARQRRDARADLANERRLRAAVETELREKASALVSLRSEVGSLRSAVDERAAHIVKLEGRMIELEPLEEQLRCSEAKFKELEAAAAPESSPAQETTSGALQEQLNMREIRINELRTHVNDLRAELETAHREQRRADSALTDSTASTARLQREQDESARKLQRQIERNRKQETVHRSVVENLQRELETLRGEARDALSIRKELESRKAGTGDSERWREALAERDSQIVAYRRRLADLEEQRHPPLPQSDRDDLKLIRGIGPIFERLLNKIGVTHFGQIAQWTPDDIERIAKGLDTNAKRIVRENWVESARQLR